MCSSVVSKPHQTSPVLISPHLLFLPRPRPPGLEGFRFLGSSQGLVLPLSVLLSLSPPDEASASLSRSFVAPLLPGFGCCEALEAKVNTLARANSGSASPPVSLGELACSALSLLPGAIFSEPFVFCLRADDGMVPEVCKLWVFGGLVANRLIKSESALIRGGSG